MNRWLQTRALSPIAMVFVVAVGAAQAQPSRAAGDSDRRPGRSTAEARAATQRGRGGDGARSGKDRAGSPRSANQGLRGSSVAAARPSGAGEPCDRKPWVCGVSAERQQRAIALYEEGNQLFHDGRWDAAAAKYRQAVKIWNHPGIHANLALVLVNLERPIEAFHSLQEALRYGPGALGKDEYERAKRWKAGVRRRLATVRVRSDQRGAVVELDGERVLTGAGEATRLVLAGEHRIDARKPGFVAASQAVRLTDESQVALQLVPQDQATVSTRRWQWWMPWVITGLGAGVVGLGAVSQVRAVQTHEEFRVSLAARCALGCAANDYPAELDELQRRFRWEQGVAYGAYFAGGLALTGGLWMAFLNRERRVDNPALQDAVQISITPVLSPGTGGIAAVGSF